MLYQTKSCGSKYNAISAIEHGYIDNMNNKLQIVNKLYENSKIISKTNFSTDKSHNTVISFNALK